MVIEITVIVKKKYLYNFMKLFERNFFIDLVKTKFDKLSSTILNEF